MSLHPPMGPLLPAALPPVSCPEQASLSGLTFCDCDQRLGAEGGASYMSGHTEMGPELALHLELGIKIIDPAAVGGLLQKPAAP